MQITDVNGWTLESANSAIDNHWLLTNETGEDVRHVYVGVDNEDPIRVVDRLESFGDITFVWQPSADQRVRVGWAPSRAKREIAYLPFPEPSEFAHKGTV